MGEIYITIESSHLSELHNHVFAYLNKIFYWLSRGARITEDAQHIQII